VSLDALLAQADVARLARALRESPGREVAPEPQFIWAAIAVILRLAEGGEPELLLIKRAEHEGDPWSGHVACPGGRRDAGDADLTATAIRETLEETALDLARDGRVLGTLDDLSPRTPYLPPIVIRPFVFAAAGELRITPSAEVASSFWVPLSRLRDSGAWGTGTIHIRGRAREERVVRLGGHVVWGLTERVLSGLTTALLNVS